MRTRPLAALALTLAMASTPAGADVVTDWNTQLLDSIRAERTNPPHATRYLALAQTAVFDAVNGVAPQFEPYQVAPTAPAGASAEAAAAAAAHRVLSAVYPARQAVFDAALAASLGAIPDGQSKDDGVAWGEEVADAILALRADDGSGAVVPYEAPAGANWWVRTPPAFAPPLLPQWPSVTPWCMKRGDQFRAPAPPPLTSAQYTRDFLEVKRLGDVDSPFRTPDQSQIAQFWDDGPGTNTPPGHWQTIAQIAAAQEGNSLIENARLFALLGLTVADAAIVAWDTKYHWDHWRPYTAIHEAATDGNPETTPDTTWFNFITTPPFPAYTSGHSTFSGGSSRILALFFGTDAIPFTAPSDGLPGVTRSYASFSQAGEEAGQSRIYGGIHWQYDNQEALKAGRALAEHVFFGFLRPLAQAGGGCTADGNTLCLQGGRFAVTADWRTAGRSGRGNAVGLNDNSGTFWFFDEDNTEVTVKVHDACDPFDRFWVFASGLTNVEVTLTVTDTQTGTVRQYFNPLDRKFQPVQDASAFATCP